MGRSFRLSRLARCDTREIDSGAPHATVIRTPSPAKVLPRQPLLSQRLLRWPLRRWLEWRSPRHRALHFRPKLREANGLGRRSLRQDALYLAAQPQQATDLFSPYSPSSADSGDDTTNGGRSIFMAYNNPNYTAQILALSLGVKW